MRAKKHNFSSESEFDSDESQEQTKLKSFPKIPAQLCVTNSKKIFANQKIVSPSLSNIEQSETNKPCQMSVIHTKTSHKEATVSRCKGQKYCDKSSDENDHLHTQKHTNKSTESKNVITTEKGL